MPVLKHPQSENTLYVSKQAGWN